MALPTVTGTLESFFLLLFFFLGFIFSLLCCMSFFIFGVSLFLVTLEESLWCFPVFSFFLKREFIGRNKEGAIAKFCGIIVRFFRFRMCCDILCRVFWKVPD